MAIAAPRLGTILPLRAAVGLSGDVSVGRGKDACAGARERQNGYRNGNDRNEDCANAAHGKISIRRFLPRSSNSTVSLEVPGGHEVCFWHLADSLSKLAARPLSG